MNSQEIKRIMNERDKTEDYVFKFAREVLEKTYDWFSKVSHKYDNESISYIDTGDGVEVSFSRYICGDVDNEWLSLPFDYFDLTVDEVVTIVKAQNEKQKLEREQKEAEEKARIKKQQEANEVKLYEKLKQKYEGVSL